MLPTIVPADLNPVAGVHHVRKHSTAPVSLGEKAARSARTWLGVPYAWGGASRSGTDCSGLVVAVYGRLGITLPHQSDELWHGLRRVRHLLRGDIVAFGYGGVSDHVGIYIGHGEFIHAVGAGQGVRIGHLFGPSRHGGFLGAVRVTIRRHVKHRRPVVRDLPGSPVTGV